MYCKLLTNYLAPRCVSQCLSAADTLDLRLRAGDVTGGLCSDWRKPGSGKRCLQNNVHTLSHAGDV